MVKNVNQIFEVRYKIQVDWKNQTCGRIDLYEASFPVLGT